MRSFFKSPTFLNLKTKCMICLMLGGFMFSAIWVAAAWAGKRQTEASAGCTGDKCKKRSLKVDASKVKKSKGKKGKTAAGVSKACPHGVGPMNTTRCPKSEEAIIAKVLGPQHVACYSSLFMVESTCSATVPHSAKATGKVPGVGLCAIEKSPVLRRGRGPDCQKIATFEQQVKCCASMMRRTQGRYYGTVKCKKTPRCS